MLRQYRLLRKCGSYRTGFPICGSECCIGNYPVGTGYLPMLHKHSLSFIPKKCQDDLSTDQGLALAAPELLVVALADHPPPRLILVG